MLFHFISRPCRIFGLSLLCLVPLLSADEFPDPAPPKFVEAPEASSDQLTDPLGWKFYQAPKPLSPDATVSDWPRFLGPSDNAHSPETHLLKSFPPEGLAKVWEIEKGISYSSPSTASGRLVLFTNLDGQETVMCLEPETGRQFWSDRYPVEYSDRYGYNQGPRASPVINGKRVYTLGVTSVLSCYDLLSGTRLWQRKLGEEFELLPYFFGQGASPLVDDGRVIVSLGTRYGLSVAAFDEKTGHLVWGTRHEWQASYASPILATLQGKKRLLVFSGGDSRPPVGGLMAIDPETGSLLDTFPWRADKYESVNGSTPVALAGDRVFLSASYGKGSAMVRLDENLKWQKVWENPDFGLHWSTALLQDGALFGFQGRNEPDAWFAALDAATGKELWQADPEFTVPVPNPPGRASRRSGPSEYRLKYFRGSLLQADGRTWALGEFGTLGILKLTREGYQELDRTQLFLARATWSLPVLHRGLLYIVQHEPDQEGHPPRLICYDLREK